MHVEHLADHLANTARLLQQVGGKAIASELERLGSALAPFRELSVAEFCELLKQVGPQRGTGGAPPGGRARPKASYDAAKVELALERLRGLLSQATLEDFKAADVHDEMERLEKQLNRDEMLALAEQFGAGSSNSKSDALMAAGQLILQRNAEHRKQQSLLRQPTDPGS